MVNLLQSYHFYTKYTIENKGTRSKLLRRILDSAQKSVISNILPVASYLLVGPELGLANLPMEIPTIAVIVISAWVQRRVLI